MSLRRLDFGLLVRRLTGRQAPRLAEYFLQERRLDAQVLGDDVEAEEVSIDAATRHGVAVAGLMPLGRHLQQLDPLLLL